MKALLVLMSHKLTQEQINDISFNLNAEIYYVDDYINTLWKNIPPELESLDEYLTPVKNYIRDNMKEGDYILIQGEPGAVYQIVKFSYDINLIPIYSTTKRISVEKEIDGKVKKISVFKHIRFRKY